MSYQPHPHLYRHENRRAPSPSDENVVMSEQDLKFYDELIRSEQDGLNGFTIAQLEDMGCWGHKNALPNDLSCPILSCWTKDRWVDVDQKMINMNIGGRIPGKWTIQNPFVWEVLEPCLRLATVLMVNMKLFPFLEAMLFGPWDEIGPDEFYMPDKYYKKDGGWRFRSQNGQNALTDERWQRCMDELQYLENDWQISLGRDYKTLNDGWSTITPPWYCARADEEDDDDDEPQGKINLSIHLIDPILKTDHFLESERLTQQFYVAMTFYEDEEIAETGWSWENDVRIYKKPLRDSKYDSGRELPRLKTQKFGKGAKMTFFPVATVYMENIQQEAFWTHVTKLGRDALKIPKIYGLQDEKEGDLRLIRGEDCDRDPASFEFPPPPLFNDEVEKWKFDQSQLVKRYSITTALREQRRTRRETGENQKTLEKAISAYRLGYLGVAKDLLDEIREFTLALDFPVLLLYSLLPDTFISESRDVVKLRFQEINRNYEQGIPGYSPRVMENIYSLAASILIVYGVMKPEDMKAADFRARVKRSITALVFPYQGSKTGSQASSGARGGKREGGNVDSSKQPPTKTQRGDDGTRIDRSSETLRKSSA
ncbi:hypothetical protein HYFRA_00010898 [Hymenoscyphus fraxineus]|uniref:Uncharacterized protein n=1 Tax=Hymenoscyphus fraxineus TaxID=746836 RepID=A0A9N9KYR3_9HELO|nr:hypothetical protein HYFRA_00010898 [Hymenoscyphus fraxineus]